jgi:hypothetical protein
MLWEMQTILHGQAGTNANSLFALSRTRGPSPVAAKIFSSKNVKTRAFKRLSVGQRRARPGPDRTTPIQPAPNPPSNIRMGKIFGGAGPDSKPWAQWHQWTRKETQTEDYDDGNQRPAFRSPGGAA